MRWTPDRIATLRDLLLRRDLSYTDISRHMGITKNAVSSAVAKYVHCKVYEGGKRYVKKAGQSVGQPERWTERYLTEPWTSRSKLTG